MDDINRPDDTYDVHATSPRVDARTHVLKNGESFAVFDRRGDIDPFGGGELGLYHEGTRYLSRLTLRIGGERPLLLSSTVKDDNDLATIDLTNPDLGAGVPCEIPTGTLHVFRSRFLWQSRCYERLRIRNFGAVPVAPSFSLEVDADFADLFEVRGHRRARRGRSFPPVPTPDGVEIAYEGLDGVRRCVHIDCSPPPDRFRDAALEFATRLEPGGELNLFVTVSFGCEEARAERPECSYAHALSQVSNAIREFSAQTARIYTSNEQFNDWINRSATDLQMLMTRTDHGAYPHAGIPWFAAPFGRDGIVTALETLWVNPEIARGVLSFLAATQAIESDSDRDAQPGKILHEMRLGEMAALGEVPFGRYYGTIDATPLFVLLAARYASWTGDRELVEGIWPNVERALAWMEHSGDQDGDGFLEYSTESRGGLVQQGWKDSSDSVFRADGSPAEGPIALSEVQGYAYAALLGAADLAEGLGIPSRPEELRRRAAALRDRFEAAFWCEELGLYVLALDGKKRACRVKTSNAGHVLFCGLATPEHAERTATTLLSKTAFSGWGIRTLASDEKRYNPMSYHNGSVWPHDNALIAAGFARYGLRDASRSVMTALFDASLYVDLHRMPELFCGFSRRLGQGPTLYPVACAPQAWAAGTPFLLLQACLGLTVDGRALQLRFHRPTLPPFLEQLEIKGLRVGSSTTDLRIERYGDEVGIDVLRREGQLEVVIIK